jgi:RHS repeat-associated protein
MTSGSSSFYYLYDGLGSVANLTSSTGASEWTYSYEPFGAIRTQTKNDPNAPANPMQFAGGYDDSATGLYDLGARQYDTADGRFLSQDPVQPASGDSDLSSYAYVDDEPLVAIDPSGMHGCSYWPPSAWAACIDDAATWTYHHVVLPEWNAAKSAFHNATHLLKVAIHKVAPYCTECLKGAAQAGLLNLWLGEADLATMAKGCGTSVLEKILKDSGHPGWAKVVQTVDDLTTMHDIAKKFVKDAEKEGTRVVLVEVRKVDREARVTVVLRHVH